MIFATAITAGDIFAISCLVIFMLSSIISLGGYLPLIVKVFDTSSESSKALLFSSSNRRISNWLMIPVALLSILVVLMGVYPTPWINWIDQVINWMAV